MQARTPAGRTGRPRSAAADAAILAATREALVDLGWSKLTMGDVAARAGVAKTTLYRRWAGKNELVVDAVAELFDELELPDRGSLAADIECVVLQFAALLARPEAKSGADGGGRRVHPGRRAAGAHPIGDRGPAEAAGRAGPGARPGPRRTARRTTTRRRRPARRT